MFSLLSSIAITNIIYLIFGKILLKTNIQNIKCFSEVSIIGFISLSFVALLLNYFTSLNIKINSFLLIIICLYFLFKKIRFSKKEFFFLLIIIFFGFFLIIFDTIYRPDAGLYHLPYTKVINNEKIIFGLANLHSRFGHISIIQYSSALNYNYFTKDIGILIPLLSIYSYFVFYFLGDILYFLFNKTKKELNYLSILFSSLVLIYVSYKINRYGEFGNDAIGNLAFFYLLSKFINYKKFNYLDFNKIYLISVFSILNKFTFIFSILIPLFIFFKNKISLKKTFFSVPTVFLLLWILRNIIVSGCAIYPEIKTCFTDLKWSNKNEIIYQSESGEAWAKDWPNRLKKDLTMKDYNKNFNWLLTWKNHHYKKINQILIPYILVLIFTFIYFKFKNKTKIYFNLNHYIFWLSIITSLIGSLFFFLKFPTYRYGYSYLISFLILCLIFLIRFFNYSKIKNFGIFVIILFSLSFLYKQSTRYIEFHKIRNLIPEIYNNQTQHIKVNLNDDFYYNLSLNGSCMYDANLCTLFKNDNLKIMNKLSYKIFIIDN